MLQMRLVTTSSQFRSRGTAHAADRRRPAFAAFHQPSPLVADATNIFPGLCYYFNVENSTGPVWFGCLVLALIGWIVAGSDFWSGYAQSFPSGHPGLIEYSRGVVLAAVHMAMQVVCVWKWTSPLYLILLYLLFCITSEITLSPTDLAGMWRGVFILVFFLILLNLIPGVNWVAFKLSDWLAPTLFVIHTVLVFVLLVDAVFYMAFKLIRRVF